MTAPQFTLYSRSYCHLCSDMAAALEAARHGRDFRVEVIDLEHHPELEARYGDKVPVLVLGGRELFHYHFDAAALESALAAHQTPDRPAQRAEFG
ncbi:MAG: glutaredoxin family protein [Betaproteobacteria bacterium]|nr:glutaredoxin family protein [Betaproteobacteria bacterium]